MDHWQTLSGHDGLDINALTPISRSYYFTELFGLDHAGGDRALKKAIDNVRKRGPTNSNRGYIFRG